MLQGCLGTDYKCRVDRAGIQHLQQRIAAVYGQRIGDARVNAVVIRKDMGKIQIAGNPQKSDAEGSILKLAVLLHQVRELIDFIYDTLGRL